MFDKFAEFVRELLFGEPESVIHDMLDKLVFQELDPNSLNRSLYADMFGLGVITAVLTVAGYLLVCVAHPTVHKFIETLKIVPFVMIAGYGAPYMAYLLTWLASSLGQFIVDIVTGSSRGSGAITISVSGVFGLWDGIIASLGANLLNGMFFLSTEFAWHILSAIIVAFVLRWWGAFGDGLFVFVVGLLLMATLGQLASVIVLAIAYYANPLSTGGVAFALLVATIMPLVILGIYLKTGLSQKVRGVMGQRQMGNRIGSDGDSDGSGSSGVKKAGLAAAGGAMAAAYVARQQRPSDSSDGSGAGQKLASGAGMVAAGVARSHPVAAAAMVVGTQILPKSKPKPGSTPSAPTPAAAATKDSARDNPTVPSASESLPSRQPDSSAAGTAGTPVPEKPTVHKPDDSGSPKILDKGGSP